METICATTPKSPVRAVLFDFDGTISTLRCGWEQVMKPLMLEMISGGKPYGEELEREVETYIGESTGIQTIHQMKWLAAAVQERGNNPGAPTDPWWYKAEYNRRLMENVNERLKNLEEGCIPREDYLIKGSEEFLKALCSRGIKLYVASGTDHPDVCREAEALGVAQYFTLIAGAPVGEENCSKEKVMARLLEEEGLQGSEVAVIGDGKVEIRLGKEAGARAVGLATDERNGGVDAVKRERLILAGADIICGDFTEANELLAFLGV
ncbi:MAG: HAD family hydrolase [Clostridia bacterium]|nr:HAD family hydrolase [Clostridia bacterium]